MQIPFRLAAAGRGTVEVGLIAAIGVATAVFMSTALVLPGLISAFDIGPGAAGFVSGVQLAGFVVTSFLAGRVTTPSPRLFVLAMLVLAGANLTTAVIDDFAALLVLRFIAGLALGVITWLSWAGVFGDPRRMGEIAVVGPIAGVVASPLVGLLVEAGSFRWVYLALGVVSFVPLLWIPSFEGAVRSEDRVRSGRGAPAAYVLIVALAMLSIGGSAVFVFGGVIAESRLAISPGAYSLVLAGNAAAGIPAARWKGDRPLTGMWLISCGLCAVIFATTSIAVVGAAAIIFWGFAFWVGIPGTYALLSRVSRFPAERAGDAQGAMAVGRILGPILGGSLIALGSEITLGIVAGSLMAAGGAAIVMTELRNHRAELGPGVPPEPG